VGVAFSLSHVVSAAPSSSGGGLLTLCPCSSVRSLSWETVLHKLLQRESFPQAAALHKLPQRGSFPRGAVLQEQAAPAWVPTGSQALPANLLWRGLLSPRVCRSWQEPAPEWAAHRVTASFRHKCALAWGPFHGLQLDICSTVDLHGVQGDSLPHHGLLHELQGKTLCSGAWSTSSPSFSTDLGVCRAVSLTSSHFSLLTAIPQQVFPLLKYVIIEALPPSLMRSALASGGSVLEPAGTGSIRHGGSFWQLLTEATPVAPLLPKPCHTNPQHQPFTLTYHSLSATLVVYCSTFLICCTVERKKFI